MTIRSPRYSKEEFAQRGNAIYESIVRSQVETGNYGKIVAIDIETGAFELAENTIIATERLYERYPNARALGNSDWTSCSLPFWLSEY